ncbi:MAG: hypothetical protein P1U65_02460 [Minwuia sp.]|nr:hypothetical protein [Minwuia sp.]
MPTKPGTVRPRRYPLPKRFSAALSEDAYARLRALNARHGFGNNYLLTILLERLDDVVDAEALDRIYAEFAAEYGAPSAGKRAD